MELMLASVLRLSGLDQRLAAFRLEVEGKAYEAVDHVKVCHLPGKCRAQARKMRAAITLRNIVSKCEDVLMVGIIPPKSCFHRDLFPLALDYYRIGNKRRLHAVKIAHKSFEAAIIVKLIPLDLNAANISKFNAHARIQKGELTETVFDCRMIKINHGEGLGRRQERDFRPALGLARDNRRRSRDHKRSSSITFFETKEMLLFVAPNSQVQPARQSIDH